MIFFVVLAVLTLAAVFLAWTDGRDSMLKECDARVKAAVIEATAAAERETITFIFRKQPIKATTIGDLRKFNLESGDKPLTVRMDFSK